MPDTQVMDADGQTAGTYRRTVDTPEGKVMLIARDERLGGGTIVVPARDAEVVNGACSLAFGSVSIREAPPYSPNVDLNAYVDYWKRLGASNYTISLAEYMPTGSGSVPSEVDVRDDFLLQEVSAALRDDAAGRSVNSHLVKVSVQQGTVLLEGYQNDTQGRLDAAAAAASVPGVKEVVNMLVIRAI